MLNSSFEEPIRKPNFSKYHPSCHCFSISYLLIKIVEHLLTFSNVAIVVSLLLTNSLLSSIIALPMW